MEFPTWQEKLSKSQFRIHLQIATVVDQRLRVKVSIIVATLVHLSAFAAIDGQVHIAGKEKSKHVEVVKLRVFQVKRDHSSVGWAVVVQACMTPRDVVDANLWDIHATEFTLHTFNFLDSFIFQLY